MADRRGRTRPRAAARSLAVVLALGLAACTPTPSATPPPTATPAPTPTGVASPEPTASAEPSPTLLPTTGPTGISGARPCTAIDLKASHGLVEGAAGSIFTTVVLVAGQTCSLNAFPAFGLRDANGAELVGSVAGGQGRLDLDPNASYESAVRFANWCGTDPAFPLELVLRLGAEEVTVTGSSFPDEGSLPACAGGGGPVLEASGWEAP